MTVTVINPATEETIATLESAGVDETDAAVARAKAAFPAWRAVSPGDRGRLLRRLATLVAEWSAVALPLRKTLGTCGQTRGFAVYRWCTAARTNDRSMIFRRF